MASVPRDEWLVIDGLSFHYRDWGGQGQPIVLLHGLASTCHIWDLVSPMLSEDFAVVALDQRGHGESDKPDHSYDFATLTGDLDGFVQALGMEGPIIVGHSWGGDVALQYAVTHPEVPKGLCFIDGGIIEISALSGMTLERAKEELAPPDFTGLTVKQLRERARSWPLGFSLTPQIEAILLATFEVQADDTVRARLSRDNHMRIIEAMWEHRPSVLYPRVECPVLLMPARPKDDESPAARRFNREEGIAVATKLLPVSKTVWLEDSVHDVPLQRPQQVADTIKEHIQGGFFG